MVRRAALGLFGSGTIVSHDPRSVCKGISRSRFWLDLIRQVIMRGEARWQGTRIETLVLGPLNITTANRKKWLHQIEHLIILQFSIRIICVLGYRSQGFEKSASPPTDEPGLLEDISSLMRCYLCTKSEMYRCWRQTRFPYL